jgi:Ca2+-binding EF-hand superfamily protein
MQAYEQLQAALNLGRQPKRPSPAHVVLQASLEPERPLHLSEARIQDAFGQVAAAGAAGQDVIAVSDVGQVLEKLGIQLTEHQQAETAAQLDMGSSGTVGMADFVTWMQG